MRWRGNARRATTIVFAGLLGAALASPALAVARSTAPTPPAAPAPASPSLTGAAPSAVLAATSARLRSSGAYLKVDIGPDLPGTGSWRFSVQRRTSTSWTTVGTYSSYGGAETRAIKLRAGVYRVYVPAQHARRAYLSASVRHWADTTAPKAAVTSPATGATVDLGATAGKLALQGTAYDGLSGVAQVAIYADGKRIGYARLKRVSSARVSWYFATSAPAGRHVLTARAIDRGAQTSPKASVAVTVRWPKAGTSVLPRTTEVLTAAERTAISDVTPTTIKVAGASPAAVGDVIVSAPTPEAPAGLLRKVTSVTTSGGQTVLTTREARITEAVTQGRWQASDVPLSLTEPPVGAALPRFGRPSQQAFELFNWTTGGVLNLASDTDLAAGKSAELEMKSTTSASLDLTVEVGLRWDWGIPTPEVRTFRTSVTVSEVATVKFKGSTTFARSVSAPLPSLHFAPITIPVGPIPLVLAPEANPRLVGEGSVAYELQGEAEFKPTATAGVEYKDGQWSPIWSWTPTWETSLKPQLVGEAQVGIEFEFALKVYGIAGPTVTVQPAAYAKGTIAEDGNGDLGLDLEAGARGIVEVGFVAGAGPFQLGDFSVTLKTLDVQLWESKRNPAPSSSPTPTASPSPTVTSPSPTPTSPSPTPTGTGVDPNGPWKQVDMGRTHACGVTKTGAAYCWGDNAWGNLGNGTTTNSSVPVPVSGLESGVVAVSAGLRHSCALTDSGAVLCWGSNQYQELGIGDAGNKTTPVLVVAAGVTAISSGMSHTCAVTDQGAAICWGDNAAGQLGDGSQTAHGPQTVFGLDTGVTAITAGGLHSCAIEAEQALVCWGSNVYGQLGDNKREELALTPVTVLTPGMLGTWKAKAVDAGQLRTCAVTIASGVACWGAGDSSSVIPVPVQVSALVGGVAAITTGSYDTCAITDQRAALCWTGSPDIANPDVVAGLPTGIADVSYGDITACATTLGGAAYCWGWGGYGQLGNGQTPSSVLPPVRVNDPTSP